MNEFLKSIKARLLHTAVFALVSCPETAQATLEALDSKLSATARLKGREAEVRKAAADMCSDESRTASQKARIVRSALCSF